MMNMHAGSPLITVGWGTNLDWIRYLKSLASAKVDREWS
jgi:hypothetical protein